MKTRTWGGLGPLVLVPVMTLGLVGCSDDGDDRSDDKPTTTETPSATPTVPTVSPPDLPEEPEVRDGVGAVADVVWDPAECGTAAGEQTVEGTLTNPTKSRVDYAIVINWTNGLGDVLGRGVEVVQDTAPDEEISWTTTATVPDGAQECVLSVLRGAVPR